MSTTATKIAAKNAVSVDTLLKAWELMCTAKAMTTLYEENAKFTAKYVHATSRGHEAIQLALGLQLLPQDYVFPYYRDDSILLGIGMEPYELMLQLMAKRDDPFSGGRTYYSHPSLRRDNMPKIPHQSSATGMQAIPATGTAMGFWYKEQAGIRTRALRRVFDPEPAPRGVLAGRCVHHRGGSGRSIPDGRAEEAAHHLPGPGQRMGHQCQC
jgi:TPP-dependent pyruvate/acetoin dehydrogenase alpha subunit